MKYIRWQEFVRQDDEKSLPHGFSSISQFSSFCEEIRYSAKGNVFIAHDGSETFDGSFLIAIRKEDVWKLLNIIGNKGTSLSASQSVLINYVDVRVLFEK